MKYKLPIFSLVVAAAGFSVFIAVTDSNSTETPQTTSTPSPANGGGNQLVRTSAANLEKIQRLEARIRQRTHVFGHQLAGSGMYRQWYDGKQFRLRLDLKAQVHGQTASYLQIVDDRFFWVHQTLPNREELRHIDLQRVADARAAGQLRSSDLLGQWILLGGLPQLLRSLAVHFDFADPVPDVLGREQIPVWTTTGTWKSAFVADPASQPSHVPDVVKLVLGRDPNFDLFPYQVTYLRDGQPLVELEFYELHAPAEIDPKFFRYNPKLQQEVEDDTDAFLKAHRVGGGE